MVPPKVLYHIFRGRPGFLLVCLLAAATGLMGQTTPYTVTVGSNPSALGINSATNQIYVVNSGLTNSWSLWRCLRRMVCAAEFGGFPKLRFSLVFSSQMG